jgi:hypothetical protein
VPVRDAAAARVFEFVFFLKKIKNLLLNKPMRT